MPNIVVTFGHDVLKWGWPLAVPWVWRRFLSSLRAVWAAYFMLYRRLIGLKKIGALTGVSISITATGSLTLSGSPPDLSPGMPPALPTGMPPQLPTGMPSVTRSTKDRRHHLHVLRKRRRRAAGKFAQWAEFVAGNQIGKSAKTWGTSALE